MYYYKQFEYRKKFIHLHMRITIIKLKKIDKIIINYLSN